MILHSRHVERQRFILNIWCAIYILYKQVYKHKYTRSFVRSMKLHTTYTYIYIVHEIHTQPRDVSYLLSPYSQNTIPTIVEIHVWVCWIANLSLLLAVLFEDCTIVLLRALFAPNPHTILSIGSCDNLLLLCIRIYRVYLMLVPVYQLERDPSNFHQF